MVEFGGVGQGGLADGLVELGVLGGQGEATDGTRVVQAEPARDAGGMEAVRTRQSHGEVSDLDILRANCTEAKIGSGGDDGKPRHVGATDGLARRPEVGQQRGVDAADSQSGGDHGNEGLVVHVAELVGTDDGPQQISVGRSRGEGSRGRSQRIRRTRRELKLTMAAERTKRREVAGVIDRPRSTGMAKSR